MKRDRRIPRDLKHRPMVMVENYVDIDGKHGIRGQGSEAKGLSLGISQWDEDQLSGKVWKSIDNRWSRISEEVPLHRILDLSILILEMISVVRDNPDDLNDLNDLVVSRIETQEDKTMTITRSEDIDVRDLNILVDALMDIEKNPVLHPRLVQLQKLLNEVLG